MELTSINQNLKKLGEGFKESHFMRRLIAGIKAQPHHPYKQALTLYKGSVIAGSPLKINQLRDLLNETYEDEKTTQSREILEAGFTQLALTRRFISAIEKQRNNIYGSVLQQHRGMMIRGSPYTMDELREFLAYVYVMQEKKINGPVMKGMATIAECKHCGRRGHNEKQCWKNPRKLNARKERKCWQCG